MIGAIRSHSRRSSRISRTSLSASCRPFGANGRLSSSRMNSRTDGTSRKIWIAMRSVQAGARPSCCAPARDATPSTLQMSFQSSVFHFARVLLRSIQSDSQRFGVSSFFAIAATSAPSCRTPIGRS